MNRFRTFLVLLLFPVAASALLGPAVPIGITEPRLGNGSDSILSIATNGNEFFVVWEESRTRPVIRAARIASNGTVVDPDGILITTDGNTPAVAWNGYAWAVTWYASTSPVPSNNNPLMGQLYDTNGQPLGPPIHTSWSKFPQSILVPGGDRLATVLHDSDVFFMTPELYGVKEVQPGSVSGYASIASDGHAFLFAASAQTGIRLTRLDADGNILGTSTITGHIATGLVQTVWSGDRYRVAWLEHGTAYAASVTADGVVSSPVAIAPSHDLGLTLSALPNGDAVAYVNTTGTIAVDLATAKATPIAASLPQLATNARGDIIGVWIDGAIRFAHFLPDGTPADDGQFLVRTPSSSSAPAGDPNGISPLVAFSVDRGSTKDIVVRDPVQVLASSSDSLSAPTLGGNGTSTLVAWANCNSTTCTVDAALVAPNAAPKRLSLATRTNVGNTKVVWTGSNYAVIWSEPPTFTLDPGPGLWMVRVSAAGDVLDSTPVRIATAPYGTFMLPTVVTGDGVTLVSWRETFVFCNCRTGYPHTLRALRLDTNGNPIDNAPFTLAPAFTGGYDLSLPTEAWDGIAFTVVWNRAGVIDGVRVLPSGSVTPFLTSTIQTTAPPMIAANGQELLLAWGDDTKSRVLTGTIDASGAVISTGGFEAPFSFNWNLALAHLGGNGIVLLSKEVLPDQTTTIMMRTVTNGRPAAHRRSG